MSIEFKGLEFVDAKVIKNSDGTIYAPICNTCRLISGISNSVLLAFKEDDERIDKCSVDGCDGYATSLVNIPPDTIKGMPDGIKVSTVENFEEELDDEFYTAMFEDKDDNDDKEKEGSDSEDFNKETKEDSEDADDEDKDDRHGDSEPDEASDKKKVLEERWEEILDLIEEKADELAVNLRSKAEEMRQIMQESEKEGEDIIEEILARIKAIDVSDLPPIIEDLETDLNKEVRAAEKDAEEEGTEDEKEELDELGNNNDVTQDEAIHTPDEDNLDDIISRIKKGQ